MSTTSAEPRPRLAFPLRLTGRPARLATCEDDVEAVAALLALVVDAPRGSLGNPNLGDPCDAPGVVREDGRPRLPELASAVAATLRAAGWAKARVEPEADPGDALGRLRVTIFRGDSRRSFTLEARDSARGWELELADRRRRAAARNPPFPETAASHGDE